MREVNVQENINELYKLLPELIKSAESLIADDELMSKQEEK